MHQRRVVARFTNAYIGYGSRVVVKDLNLTVHEGSLTVLLGPNGSGKTTILRSLFGLANVIMGRVEVHGHVAYAPAELDGYINLTVTEVLETARDRFGWVSRDKALRILKETGLGDLANVRFFELSTGQKRLVMLARAIASDADLVLVDEPTANLDPGNRARVLRMIKGAAANAAVIVATHDVDMAFLADQVVMIKDGMVMGQGQPRGVLTQENLSKLYGVEVRLIDYGCCIHAAFVI